MGIIRVEKNANYSVVSNIPLNDKSLSREARGVMAYLLSKPNDWTISVVDLVRQSPAGKFVIKRVLKELESHGYIVRTRCHGVDGKFYWLSTVNEKPTMDQFSIDGLSMDGYMQGFYYEIDNVITV